MPPVTPTGLLQWRNHLQSTTQSIRVRQWSSTQGWTTGYRAMPQCQEERCNIPTHRQNERTNCPTTPFSICNAIRGRAVTDFRRGAARSLSPQQNPARRSRTPPRTRELSAPPVHSRRESYMVQARSGMIGIYQRLVAHGKSQTQEKRSPKIPCPNPLSSNQPFRKC